jgi:hypothetical protein
VLEKPTNCASGDFQVSDFKDALLKVNGVAVKLQTKGDTPIQAPPTGLDEEIKMVKHNALSGFSAPFENLNPKNES